MKYIDEVTAPTKRAPRVLSSLIGGLTVDIMFRERIQGEGEREYRGRIEAGESIRSEHIYSSIYSM